jgi:hypothetical protein
MRGNTKNSKWTAAPGRMVTLSVTRRTRVEPTDGRKPPARGKLNYLCKTEQPRVSQQSKPCWLLQTIPVVGKFVGHEGQVTAFLSLEDLPVSAAANDPG